MPTVSAGRRAANPPPRLPEAVPAAPVAAPPMREPKAPPSLPVESPAPRPPSAPPAVEVPVVEVPVVEVPVVEVPVVEVPGQAGAEAQAPRRKRRFRWPWRRPARPAEAAATRLRAMASPAESLPDESPPAEPESPALPPSLPFAGLPPMQVPLRPLAEGFALLLLLGVLDFALGSGDGFAHWPASPFQLPILYVAARYGLWAGLAVALAAGVMRLGLALSADVWTSAAWTLPLVWPLAAILVGTFSDLARQHLKAAQRAADAAEADRAAIAEANLRLAERALELDAQLGARLRAMTAVFEAARILGNGTEGVIRGATGLLRAATGCTACSFWLAEDRTLHLVAAEGWPQGRLQGGTPPLSQTILPGPLTDAIARGRGALVATRLADRLALGHEGMLAAPVLSPWDEALLGMVKVEDIGFEDLGLDTIAALEAAAGWLGAALAEARAREASEASAGVVGLSGLAAPGGLILAGEEASRAIAAMTGMARRLGFELAQLSAEIPAGPRGASALEATRAAMAEAFRGSDLLLESRLEDRRLSILLPGAAVAGAEVAAARLRTLLAERAPAATAQVIVGIALLHSPAGGGWQSRHGG